jgi:hypothetical protein
MQCWSPALTLTASPGVPKHLVLALEFNALGIDFISLNEFEKSF